MEEIIKHIETEEELDRVIQKLSTANPDKYLTYHAVFHKVWFFLHTRKPQSPTTGGAESTYRYHGGFFKDGKIVKPSPSFIKKYNFCPVLG